QRYESAVKAQFGTNHLNYAVALLNLAAVFEKQGQYAEAQTLYQRALTIEVTTLGSNHTEATKTLNKLTQLFEGRIRSLQRSDNEKEALLKQLLEIRADVLGPNNQGLLKTLNSLVSLYEEQEKFDEAEVLLNRAVGIGEQALGA